MSEPVVIVRYDPRWPSLFHDAAERLRAELGGAALRIDHIGSTAVEGLDAKPVIDIQVSVASIEPLGPTRDAIVRAGFVHRPDNSDRTKHYFREQPGSPRTHIHVRRAGSFSEQASLLLRDFLRAHPVRAAEYAALKRRLAELHSRPEERHGYVNAKGPFIWEMLSAAHEWAQRVGWDSAEPLG